MAKLNINGKTVEVDDSFLSMSPEQQNATVEEISSSMRPPVSGSLLPLSRDAKGNIGFDSDAGIVGTIKRALNLPGDVYYGKTPIRNAEGNISDEAIARSTDLAGLASPVNPAVRAGENVVGGQAMRYQKKIEPPTADALKSASQAGYDNVKNMGVEYSSQSVKDAMLASRQNLEGNGILAELAPKTHSIINKLTNPPEGSVASVSGLEAARRSFGQAAKDFGNPTEQSAARRAMSDIDTFMSSPPDNSVLKGDIQAVANALKEGRGNYGAAMRSEKVAGVLDKAELNAAVANSGQNLGNSIRQGVKSIVAKPKEAAGFSPEELAALEGVARGSFLTNAARFAGNLMGGGGGLGAAVTGGMAGTAGFMAGGPLGAAAAGAAIPATGYGLKKLSTALTERALSKADDLIRTRSPLYEAMQADAPKLLSDPAKRSALVRALMMQQSQLQSENQYQQ